MSWQRLLFRLLLGARLPLARGTLLLDAIERPARITRDRWGIPHIEAETDHDAWFALGFCHGQDRAFQVEMLYRVTTGRMAELAGRDALPIDRLARRVGFVQAARAQLALSPPDLRSMLEAYVAGVHAGATRGLRRVPHEFVLLRGRPTRWTAADALAVIGLQSFLLASNWDVELARYKVLLADGPDALAALDPTYPEWLPVTTPSGATAGPAVDRLAEDLAAFREASQPGGASNNWAVAAARTATGRPILANDPHLGATLPPHWYLAHVRTPGWAIAGASFVGGPAFPAGHNGHAAWGITAGLVDNTDLFIEEIGPDGTSVRQGDGFMQCELRDERIEVRGRGPVVERVLVTPRGPIVGPALDAEAGAVSLCATWLRARPVEGLLRLHEVRSFAEFRRCFERWPVLPLNMVYADAGGTTGWQLTGEAPRRRGGNNAFPLPGASNAVGWEAESVPFDQMPHVQDPPEGFVATANAKPAQDGAGPHLGFDWLDGYRLERVAAVLAERADWDVAATAALQLDVLSGPWRDLRDVVLAAPRSAPDTAAALQLLRTWDGRMSADSPAAAVFELFLAEIARRVARAKAPNSYEWVLGRGFHPLLAPHTAFLARRTGHLVRLLREQPEGWFPRPWAEEIAHALAAAVETLRGRFGADPRRWSWGRVRPVMLVHAVGQRRPMNRVFNLGPFPWGGDTNTVAQASVDLLDPAANPGYIASLRVVIDVGAWENSRFVLPGGQSGNPMSPHYADQLPLWRHGAGIPIPWSEAAVRAAAVDTLELTPAQRA